MPWTKRPQFFGHSCGCASLSLHAGDCDCPAKQASKADTIGVTVVSRAAAVEFFPKMRVHTGEHLRWSQRLWRWITKRNWRVRDVNFHTLTITLERCR